MSYNIREMCQYLTGVKATDFSKDGKQLLVNFELSAGVLCPSNGLVKYMPKTDSLTMAWGPESITVHGDGRIDVFLCLADPDAVRTKVRDYLTGLND